MLHSTIKFDKIPGFSKLFIDFINDSEFFNQRFPTNKSLNDGTFDFQNFSFSDEKRLILKGLITKSLGNTEQNTIQKENLQAIGKSGTYAVVTGQQAGFLGGPTYTLLKAYSAASLAKKMKIKFPEFTFVPLFWIEDNDHDLIEASVTRFFDKEWNISVVSSTAENSSSGIPLSDLCFDTTALTAFKQFIDNSPQTEFTGQLERFLEKVYFTGAPVSDAFLSLMNHFLNDTGILFLKASEVRKSGIWKELILKELSMIGGTDEIIQQVNCLLEQNGYHLQAKSNNTNLFLQSGNKRQKINFYADNNYLIDNKIISRDNLVSLCEKNPNLFSPNVLLRPLFQDFVIPTVAYIGGPSEIGYCSQITDLYRYFQITLPAFYMRHSATIISPKFGRNIEKSSHDITFYFRKFQELENEFNSAIMDNETEQLFENMKQKIREIYSELKDICDRTDKTLTPASFSTMEKSIQLMEHLHGKIKTAGKRKFSSEFTKLKQTSDYLYPDGALQERIFTFLSFINLTGTEKFKDCMNEISNLPADKHILYYL